MWPFDSGTPGTYHRKVQIIEETPGAGQTSDSELPGVLMWWPWKTCIVNPSPLQTWTRTLAPSGSSPSHWAAGGVRCAWEIWWRDFSGKQRELSIVNSANIYQADKFPAVAATAAVVPGLVSTCVLSSPPHWG